MIDEVIELPRPYGKVNGRLRVSSCRAYEPPSSPLGEALGLSCGCRDMPVCIGSDFDILAGDDAMYRYKFLEHDSAKLREYFAVASAPISSKQCVLFTLWVDEIDKATLIRTRSRFWKMIASARAFFGFRTAELASVGTSRNVRTLGRLINVPELVKKYPWPHDHPDISVDDMSDFNRMQIINANLAAFDDALASDAFLHEFDVFRGAFSDDPRPVGLTTCLGKTLARSPIRGSDIRSFIGPNYSARLHSSWIVNPLDTSSAELDAPQDANGWIDVFKYVSDIPYSEVSVAMKRDGCTVMRVTNPYDRAYCKEADIKDPNNKLTPVVEGLRNSLNEIPVHWSKCYITRSWCEEVYITLMHRENAYMSYYFDMAYLELSSPMFQIP